MQVVQWYSIVIKTLVLSATYYSFSQYWLSAQCVPRCWGCCLFFVLGTLQKLRRSPCTHRANIQINKHMYNPSGATGKIKAGWRDRQCEGQWGGGTCCLNWTVRGVSQSRWLLSKELNGEKWALKISGEKAIQQRWQHMQRSWGGIVFGTGK